MHLGGKKERSGPFSHLSPTKKETAINTENIWKNGSLDQILLKPQTFSYSLFCQDVRLWSQKIGTQNTKRVLLFVFMFVSRNHI